MFRLVNEEHFAEAFSLIMLLINNESLKTALSQVGPEIIDVVQVAGLRMCSKIKEIVLEASKTSPTHE